MTAVPQGPLDGHAPETARTRRIEAIVISNDDGLIIDLGPPLGDRYRTRPTDSAEDLPANPGGGQALIILDAVRDADARTLAARLESRRPAVPIIAVIADGDEAQWAPALARGTVVAAVPRAAVGGPALRRALEAAETRLRAGTPRTPGPPPAAARAEARRLPGAALGTAALVALALAAGAWYYFHGRASRPATTAGTVAAPAADVAGSVPVPGSPPADTGRRSTRSALELLSAARVAFASQRQLPRSDTEFRGDSALELYVQALAIDPRNEEARDGVRRLFNVARTRIQSDLSNGRFDAVTALLALFHAAGMEAEATTGIETDLATARPRWLTTQAQAAISAGDIPAAEQSLAQLATSNADPAVLDSLQRSLAARREDLQLQEMAAAVHAAIAAGNLLEPLADNARTRVQAMRQINRTHGTTLAAQHEYAAALLARAQDASHARQFDAAQRYLSAAGDVASADELSAARSQLQADMDLAAQSAAAAAASQAARPADAPSAPAPVINAHPLRPLAVASAPLSRQERVPGYVLLEFTLTADGRAADIVVVESQPQGVFDRAAIDAVAKGRFDTAPLGPEGKPQRARIRMSFK